MCSICGMVNPVRPISAQANAIEVMGATMRRRGPDQQGRLTGDHMALQHNRLAIIDLENGVQPMTRHYRDQAYTIVYNGEIYNAPELTALIRQKGVEPESYCDTEVVLWLYILFGDGCAAMLNGIFAFAIYDHDKNRLYLARDRFGIKPLFYAFDGETLLFASEIKALLAHPGIRPALNWQGLWQLLFLSPVRLPGTGVFRDIHEVLPAHHGFFDAGGLSLRPYWQLRASVQRDSRADAIENVRALLTDAIERQLVSDVPLCTLLSGGLDSSIISAVAARAYHREGRRLTTYSFEYEGNRENFHATMFQPNTDDDYAKWLAGQLGTDHHVLTAPTEEVARLLEDAVIARDMPGQADIDSSLLYFCREIKRLNTVALSGECADEIFGGYPWFYRPEMLENPFFPWIHNPMARISLFRRECVHPEEGYAAMSAAYRRSMEACPALNSDSPSMRQSRVATWLSVNYFMASLLERKDRMSMYSSVEVRVPFADHRILEYVYNVPWEIKFEGNVEKALLRNAMADVLPDEILHRKKSPYPKTQNPEYERLVTAMLMRRLDGEAGPLSQIIDRSALDSFLAGENNTWFGQLMSRPQMIAWLLQFDIWLSRYGVTFAG